jgi:hypothetical protein
MLRGMTKQEFILRRDAFYRRDTRRSRVQIAVFFVVCGACYAVARFVPAANDVLVIVISVLSVAVLLSAFRVPNQAQQEGLVCRACNNGLLNAVGDVAIETGRCPHCGSAPFDE